MLVRRALLAAGLVGGAATGVEQLRYAAPESERDRRFDDMVALLDDVLRRTEASHGPMLALPSRSGMNTARRLVELASGQLDVSWGPDPVEGSQRVIALPFDLRRGLLGLRVALIHRDRQAQLDGVRDLKDLRRLRVGQGVGWPDVKFYQRQRVPIVSAGSYEALFRMLVAGRFDLFPRGVGEVYREWQDRHLELPTLAVEKGLLLHYPLAYRFYVNPARPALAQRIEAGLLAMQADGSLDRHLWRFHGAAVRHARLNDRRRIALGPTAEADLAFWSAPPRGTA